MSWRQRLSLQLYRHADRIVACSAGVGRSVSAMFPALADRVSVIPNGVPLGRVRRLGARPLERAHAALFADPLVISVGRVDHQKGRDLLVAAHAELRRRGSRHRLVLVGQGGLKGTPPAQCRALGAEDSVHFLGFRANPYRFMSRARVFALSSRHEGFGLVLVEAMACRLPVVAADCPSGPRECWTAGATASRSRPRMRPRQPGRRGGCCQTTRNAGALRGWPARAKDFDLCRIIVRWEALLDELSPR